MLNSSLLRLGVDSDSPETSLYFRTLELPRHDELCHGWNSSFDRVVLRLRIASSERRKCPGSLLQYCLPFCVFNSVDDNFASIKTQDAVSEPWVVCGDVADSPNGLFTDVFLVLLYDVEEGLDALFVDDGLALLGASAGHVCEDPGGL